MHAPRSVAVQATHADVLVSQTGTAGVPAQFALLEQPASVCGTSDPSASGASANGPSVPSIGEATSIRSIATASTGIVSEARSSASSNDA
jgi:hypothetical protein